MVGGSESRTRKHALSCPSSTSLWHNPPLPHLITSESATGNISHKALRIFSLLLVSSSSCCPKAISLLHTSQFTWQSFLIDKPCHCGTFGNGYKLQFVKALFLCNNYGTIFSPFPLAIALKKGDTSLPETSSGCVVIPSLTAWNPFSMMTGAHPNHKVNMLPWIFASYRWERSQESTDEIPHAANRGWTCFYTDYRTSPEVEWCSPLFPQDYNYLWERMNSLPASTVGKTWVFQLCRATDVCQETSSSFYYCI